ncbi:MAG: SMC-Scp complex subunit ScpB [Bdellovibrionales bacterium]|nr:SMC-Scp complex subunit ScpB [Bdellovibrionales bacterium]
MTEEVIGGEDEEFELDELEEGEEDRAASVPLSALVSSMLFVSPRPVSAEKISKASKRSLSSVEAVLEELRDLYQDDVHGFSLHEVNDGWQFRTAPGCSPSIRRMLPRRVKRLSRAAAESLAIIAYKQPVDRSEIESIRGVDALPTLRTLLDAKLIRIVGKRDVPGQPALYGTTEKFLETFGLRDLTELPSLHELEQLLSEPGEGGAELSDEDLEQDQLDMDQEAASSADDEQLDVAAA